MKEDKKQARLRRARQTRKKIAELRVVRLAVHRTNSHMYAQVIDASGSKVLASASTVEPALRKAVKSGGNVEAAVAVGKAIAEKAKRRLIAELHELRLPIVGRDLDPDYGLALCSSTHHIIHTTHTSLSSSVVCEA